MSVLEVPQIKRTPRQQEIIDVARHIIISQGIESLTIREIAAELGVTDGALYRHFRSKKDILSLLIEDIEQTLIGVISQVASQDKNPIEKLENIFFAHFQYTEQRRGTSFIIINETLNINDKSLREKMKNVLDKYFKIIESILSQGKHSGDFRQDLEVDVAGVVFFGMVQSTVTLWSLSGYEPALDNGWLGKMFSVYKTGIVNGIL